MSEESLYVCESCGHSTPVDGISCPECEGKMVVYNDKTEPNYEDLEDEELDSTVDLAAGDEFGTESLEDLASKEQQESDQDYMSDILGEDDE